ncbi:MAG: type II CAAX prenyl endopeptidase Rce1 family protein [Planctomycetia bacterium]
MTRFSPNAAEDGREDGRFSAASIPETGDPVHEALFPDGLPLGEPLPDELAGAAAESGDLDSAGTAEDSYWQLSRTPLTSLVFTLPLVLAYEGGVLVMGRGSPRNGADVWLRHLLDALGFGQYFLLPLLTVAGLLTWHFLAHDRWRVSLRVMPGMVAECVLWAVVLVGVARLQQSLWPFRPGLLWEWLQVPGGGDAAWHSPLARIIGYCGAGLYEEVLFRLLILPVAVWAFERLGCSALAAGFWAILLSSVLFSAAHYVGPLGDSFGLYSFTFRAVAGLFFALLLLARGFGIAAGTHFFYDVLVGLA